MQSIPHDSELMTQYVAAKGFPDSSRPIAARDEYGRLLLFTFGTDSKFYVSKVDDGSGQRMLLNLGDMLDLKEDYVGHAMSVTQNPVSDKLYIVLAIAHLGADTQSHLYLLRAFHPSEKDLGSRTTHLNDLIIPEHNEKFSRVHSIHMADTAANDEYPPTLLAYQTSIHKSQDLASVAVTKQDNLLRRFIN